MGAGPTREVWASRSVYRLLLFIFRPRPGKKPVAPPFLKNRPLTETEFRAAQEHYVSARYRRRDRSEVRGAGRDLSKIFPFFDEAAESGDWDAHQMIGRAMFASKSQQQRERNPQIPGTLVWSSTRGPRPRRKFLAQARRALPQAKNRGPLEALKIAAYRRGREFVWAFLVGEGRALEQNLGSTAAADTLAQHYPYLGLTVEQIRAGLLNPDKQPDLDTAEEFHIRPSSVRRIL